MFTFLSNAWDINRANGFINWFYSPDFVFGIAKYAICILIGIIVAYLVCIKEAEKFGIHHDDAIVCLTIIVPLAILGARIWYMVGDGVSTFSNYWTYSREVRGFSGFGSVFTTFFYVVLDVVGYNSYYGTYEGISGLAIHGGIIVAFSLATACCFWKKWKPLVLCDKVAPGLFIGQIFGRWGNFTNREAFGEYTDGLFAMRLPISAIRSSEITDAMWEHVTDGINYVQVSPTFLYESMWNVMILVLMLLYIKHKKFNGEVCLLYLGGYGLGRMWIESLRTDQLLIPGTTIPVSQVLAACLFIFAVVTDIVVRVLISKGKLKGVTGEEAEETTEEKVEETIEDNTSESSETDQED